MTTVELQQDLNDFLGYRTEILIEIDGVLRRLEFFGAGHAGVYANVEGGVAIFKLGEAVHIVSGRHGGVVVEGETPAP